MVQRGSQVYLYAVDLVWWINHPGSGSIKTENSSLLGRGASRPAIDLTSDEISPSIEDRTHAAQARYFTSMFIAISLLCTPCSFI